MNLNCLLKGIDYDVKKGNDQVVINNLQYNSKNVTEGDVFFCIKGFKTDGHNYAESAVNKGARVIVCEDDICINSEKDFSIIKVKDSRKALALSASNFYDNPSKKFKIIGITGTNGKTTTTYMIKSILEEAGYKVGLIGTIANYIGDKKIKTERTTPESLELQKLFSDMAKEKVDYCVMEVSSHSLSLDRVYGVNFDYGIFTNLTQDHLDFHKTFENYYNAKLKLFKSSKFIAVNMDDNYGKRILSDVNFIKDINKFTYSIKDNSELKAYNIKIHSKGIDFSVYYKNNLYNIELGIPGRYNIYNALSAISICLNEGINEDYIIKGLKKVTVPGRCEIVTKSMDLGYDIILDYAHTPDGLSNILDTAREFTEGRLISVYGCGGDRDALKRPIMGKIGSELSDIAIVTSDNPRTEEPGAIISDIVKGIEKENYIVIENRKEAIKEAIFMAKKGDVIVIAGKGHENYQILKDEVIHFDEREVINEILSNIE